jgi:soluble lytic murein transglycosylase-like protein
MSRSCASTSVRALFLALAIFFLPSAIFAAQARAWADDEYGLLVKGVLAYYAEICDSNLPRDSDRGEDGLLLMSHEVARSLGLAVYVDEDYLESRRQFATAEEFLDRAIDAMTTTVREKREGEHVAEVAHFACLYQETMVAAVKTLKKYRAALGKEKDERFDQEKCAGLLRRLFREGLEGNRWNLRDALGHVYNRCQGIEPDDGYPLTPENIPFVNYVYNYFIRNSSSPDLQKFDTDSVDYYAGSPKLDFLKRAVGRVERRYLPFLEPVLQDFAQDKYAVQPSLFLALMRQESRFNPLSVSQVGAAGITQIMPGTGLLLGMRSIFTPPYFKEAREIMLKERRMRARALRLIQEPEKYCLEADARKARRMMQEALLCKKKRVELYKRYKRELLSGGKDERLDPRKAIEAGYRLFSELMKEQRGDISLALAAYNAGSRVVKKYKGLPPYSETVTFRNRVLRYYREYLNRMGWTAKTAPTDG